MKIDCPRICCAVFPTWSRTLSDTKSTTPFPSLPSTAKTKPARESAASGAKHSYCKTKKTFYNFRSFQMILNACLIKSHHDLLVFTFGTFKERSIADTAASAAPAGLPPWPLVVGDPPVTAEVDICWGDTAAEEAPGGKEPTAFVLRTGCFCRLAWCEKNSALLMLFLISQHINNAKWIKIFWCIHIINKCTY